MGRSPSRLALLFIPLVFACFALSPRAQAVSPAPDGGYPGGNTAEGTKRPFSLTTGGFNTAVGFFSLRSNTTGQLQYGHRRGDAPCQHRRRKYGHWRGSAFKQHHRRRNTANGAFALFSNTTGGSNTAIGDSALSSNTTGTQNTATDQRAVSNTTASATRPSVLMRSLATPPATTTRPMGWCAL